MIDMQLLNSALMAVAVLLGAAITLSIAIAAVSAITRRGQARHGGTGGTGGTGPVRQPHPAPETDDARRLVLR